MLFAVHIRDIQVLHLLRGQSLGNVIANLKSAVIRVSENDDSPLHCQAANKLQPLFILIYSEPAGFYDHGVQEVRQLDLVILALHDHCFLNMNHWPLTAITDNLTIASSSKIFASTAVLFSARSRSSSTCIERRSAPTDSLAASRMALFSTKSRPL